MRELKKCSFEWENKIPKEWMEVRLKDVLSKQSRQISDDDQIVICSNQGKVTYRGEKNPGLVSMTENGTRSQSRSLNSRNGHVAWRLLQYPEFAESAQALFTSASHVSLRGLSLTTCRA